MPSSAQLISATHCLGFQGCMGSRHRSSAARVRGPGPTTPAGTICAAADAQQADSVDGRTDELHCMMCFAGSFVTMSGWWTILHAEGIVITSKSAFSLSPRLQQSAISMTLGFSQPVHAASSVVYRWQTSCQNARQARQWHVQVSLPSDFGTLRPPATVTLLLMYAG
jgi:hypothetical protein